MEEDSPHSAAAVDTRALEAQIFFADELREDHDILSHCSCKPWLFGFTIFFLSVKLITFIGVKTTTKFIIKDFVMKTSFIQ